MRTLFLGDLEAQYKLMQQELEQQLLPEVDRVIDLGNLISCSKTARDKQNLGRNELALTFWDRIEKPKVRIAGAYEIMALNFPDEWTNSTSNGFLRDSWLSPEPTMLTATSDRGRLVTHGGLTYGLWVDLGRPDDAHEAAELLNERYSHTLSQGPCLRLDGRPSLEANPIWADPVLELYPSWILAPEPCPFDQIHGGESINTVRGRAAAAYKTHPLAYVDSISYRKFGSMVDIGGAIFRAIDLDLPSPLLQELPSDKAFYVENT